MNIFVGAYVRAEIWKHRQVERPFKGCASCKWEHNNKFCHNCGAPSERFSKLVNADHSHIEDDAGRKFYRLVQVGEWNRTDYWIGAHLKTGQRYDTDWNTAINPVDKEESLSLFKETYANQIIQLKDYYHIINIEFGILIKERA